MNIGLENRRFPPYLRLGRKEDCLARHARTRGGSTNSTSDGVIPPHVCTIGIHDIHVPIIPSHAAHAVGVDIDSPGANVIFDTHLPRTKGRNPLCSPTLVSC